MHFNLAPLRVRREIAILGVIHRTILGRGPPQFRQFFYRDHLVPSFRARRRHSLQVVDVRNLSRSLNLARHSPLGMASIYNLLLEDVISHKSISSFQRALTNLIRERVSDGDARAYDIFCPRLPLAHHPRLHR